VSTNVLIGKTLGQYRIVSTIGRGGMAIVYKAEQSTLNRFVALKVLLPTFTGEDASVTRLQREAQAAAGLDHPNIVAIYEVGEDEGLHYIAMKYIEGQPLDAILKEQKGLPPDRVIKILAQVASALDYAHRRNLVHRDIKPSNVIVGPDDRITLTDFGLVKSMGTTTLTSSGALVGTPAYMAPEQARGEETDYRADIYSLGVVAFEMLTGRPPFEGNPLSIILAHASQTPPSLRALRAAIPPAAEAVVARALAKEPGERYGTTGEFVVALRKAFTRPGEAPATPPIGVAPTPTPAASVSPMPAAAAVPAPKSARRFSPRLLWLALIPLFLAAAALVIGLGSWGGRPLYSYLIGGQAPTPTSTTVVVADTATPLPPSDTPAPTQIPATATPSPTRPLPSPTPSTTPTPRPPATATVTAAPPSPTITAPPATATAAPSATPSPSPAPTRAPATAIPPAATIQLLEPAAGQAFRRTDTPVLRWSRSAPLAAGEQFVVVIDRVPPPPNTGVWHDYHITSAQTLTAAAYLAQTTADGRFEWYVQVMRAPRADNGVLAGELVGSPSPKRIFTWEIIPTPTPGGSGPGPTPTRDFRAH
jgi:serine/threonine-protein kinase